MVEVKPRKPPMSPRINPMKFMDTIENPTTRRDPNFLVLAFALS